MLLLITKPWELYLKWTATKLKDYILSSDSIDKAVAKSSNSLLFIENTNNMF